MSTKDKKVRKVVDFTKFGSAGNRGRAIDIASLNQLQDSLIARDYGLPQRLAILATAAQEMGKDGYKSRGIGGNGYLGYSESRMPLSYLKNAGKQIHFLLNDLETIHPNNWLDGGTGGPVLLNGKDAYNKFWNAVNVIEATKILNKSNIRPAAREDAWNNRATVAKNMQNNMYEKEFACGGKRKLACGGKRRKAFLGTTALINGALSLGTAALNAYQQKKLNERSIAAQEQANQAFREQQNAQYYMNSQDLMNDYNMRNRMTFANGGTKNMNGVRIGKGGDAVQLNNDTFLLRGGSHKDGGINIGRNINAEGGEVVRINPTDIKILSKRKMGSKSPVETYFSTGNFEQAYSKQENYKRRNHLTDSGNKRKAAYGLDVPFGFESKTAQDYYTNRLANSNQLQLSAPTADLVLSDGSISSDLLGYAPPATPYLSSGLTSVGKALITNSALNKMRGPAEPVYYQTLKYKTNYNINPQLQANANSTQRAISLAQHNTSSSAALQARMRQAENSRLNNEFALYGNKENQETQLLNNYIAAQQSTNNANADKLSAFNKENIEFYNNIAGQKADNWNNLLNNINETTMSYNKQYDANYNSYLDRATSLASAYSPNVYSNLNRFLRLSNFRRPTYFR